MLYGDRQDACPTVHGEGETLSCFQKLIRFSTQSSVRSSSVLVYGQTDAEAGFAGLGFEFDFPAVAVADDAVADD
jgi:hypothetical protein